MTHHPKGFKKVMTGENRVIYFNQKKMPSVLSLPLTYDILEQIPNPPYQNSVHNFGTHKKGICYNHKKY